jgi:adenosylhomocysteine nucleosidase
MIGIIGAMASEIQLLLEDLQDRVDEHYGTFTLHVGRLENHPVTLAQCGVGKVNAAALTQLMMLQDIDQVIFTGVAGAIDDSLAVGDIVISQDAMQSDPDVRALGYKLGEVPGEPLSWPADLRLLALAQQAANKIEGINVKVGRVLSCDQFIASPEKSAWLRETFAGLCTEMEGAAMAQICAKWQVPFVIIRSISDSADHGAKVDFREFTELAASRAKQVVREMLRHMS